MKILQGTTVYRATKQTFWILKAFCKLNWTSSENMVPIDEFTQFDDTITSRCNGAWINMEYMAH